MNIIETEVSRRLKGLPHNNYSSRIVLHHAEATNCTVEDIDRWHRGRGWQGIGYHYFVRKDGQIYKGRPDYTIGAHCLHNNTNTIGICAEGKYMVETMPEVQKQAIISLCKSLGIKDIKGHRELNSTDCPGRNYPLEEIRNAVVNTQSSTPVQVQKSTPKPQARQLATWKINIQGQIIKDLQYQLNVQCNANLKVDGYCGDNTVNKLITVRKGARGEITRIIQKLLIKKGYSVGSYGADSVFGNGTYNAVCAIQRDNGLSQDGIVGRNTWKVLLRA